MKITKLKIEVTPPIKGALEKLVRTGLFGRSIEEAAQILIERKLWDDWKWIHKLQ